MENNIAYCKKCVNPVSSVAMSFNQDNICSACEYHDAYEAISNEEWENRKKI